MGGVASEFAYRVNRARLRLSRARAHENGHAVIVLADVVLTYLGVPGAITCLQYFVIRWRRRLAVRGVEATTAPEQGHTR